MHRYTIGPEGSEHVFSGKVQLLDRSVCPLSYLIAELQCFCQEVIPIRYTSVGSVVESLNRGSPALALVA